MTNPARICVVGSSNTDLFFRTPRLPQPGETLTGHGFHIGFGGKGANQAVTAARLGAHVTLICRVGNDAFGEQTVRHYQAEGIDVRHVSTDEERPSGVAGIVVDDQARNCIIVVPGANHGLSPASVRAAADAIESADLLVCQLEVPLETTLEACRVAKAAGVRTLFNPAPAIPVPDELFRLADLCVPNETELELLTGRPVATMEQVETAARVLQERGAQTLIVTLGGRGSLLLGKEEQPQHVPAMPVAAVDTTGAGDAFIGGLAVALGEGRALGDAVRRATAVAALSVTRPGTQSSFPRAAEVEAFLASRS